jgi:multidrug efflux pump subunit AcrA (membrane-fusion protein)
LAKAKTDFETFQKEYERVRELRQKGVASISELTRAMLELQQYEDAVIRNENEKTLFPSRRELLLSRLRTHQADRKLAEIDLGHTDVRPPFSGTLSEVMIERGQYVRVGDPLVRLTDIADVVIAVSLTLTDYAKIAEGIREGRQPAVGLAENETAPVRWRGLAARVAPEADESTRTVKIFVQVDNRLQAVPLLPGTFVHARVEGPILAGAIVVPRDALKSGKFYVARGERAEPREVTVLQTLQSLAVVKAGLTTGDQVILTNLDMIHAGAAVSVQSHRTFEEELRGQRVPVVQPVARREPQQPAFVPDESSEAVNKLISPFFGEVIWVKPTVERRS